MFDAVNSRTLSGLPLSVGTSLALESVFEPITKTIDPDRKLPEHIDISEYNEVWVNIGTLFRNMYTSIDRSMLAAVRANEMADAIISEMDVIASLVNESNQGNTRAIFYYCSYDDLTERFKLGGLRLANTEKQLAYANLYKTCTALLLRRSEKQTIREIQQYSSKFSGGPRSEALVITHFPIDLLNYKKFKTLDLLESHTGVLKKQPVWYTKYYDGRDLNMLPFNGILLTVFGDDHHFKPQSKAMKEAVLTLAKERRWNCLTPPAAVVEGIKTMRDHALRDALLKQEH